MLHFLFSFRGRINRRKLLMFQFVIAPVAMTAILIVVFLVLTIFGIPKDIPVESPVGIVLTVVTGTLGAVYTYAYAAVAAKRMHDRNKSALWLLAYVAIGIILVKGGDWLSDAVFKFSDREIWFDQMSDIAGLVLSLAGAAVVIWMMIELYFLKGTAGDNRFGQDPLGGPVINPFQAEKPG